MEGDNVLVTSSHLVSYFIILFWWIITFTMSKWILVSLKGTVKNSSNGLKLHVDNDFKIFKIQKETLVLYTVCKPHICLCITIREHKTGSWSLVVNNTYYIILLINQYGSILKSIRFYTLTLLIGSLFQNSVSLMVKNLLISSLIAFTASLYAFILVSALSFTINSFPFLMLTHQGSL